MTLENQFAKLAARGVTVIVSSGDDGSDYKPACMPPVVKLKDIALNAKHRYETHLLHWFYTCLIYSSFKVNVPFPEIFTSFPVSFPVSFTVSIPLDKGGP